jgi:hypothetical protein
MKADQITCTQDHIEDVPLQRFTAHAGEVEVGYVEYDGGNRMWVWSSRLADGVYRRPPSTGWKHGYGAGLRTSDRSSIDSRPEEGWNNKGLRFHGPSIRSTMAFTARICVPSWP